MLRHSRPVSANFMRALARSLTRYNTPAPRASSRVSTRAYQVSCAIVRDLFDQQVATHQVHEHQHQALQEGFVHRPDDRSHLAIGYPLVLPSRCRFKDHLFQRLHHPSQGARRTAHMRLKAKMSEKLADRFGPNTSLEAEDIEDGHYQADQPTAAFFGFPKPRLRVTGSPVDSLFETMDTAFGKPGLMGNLSNALLRIVTKRVENQKTFGPKSHVGRSSEGWLNSGWNSAPQRT